MDALVASAIKGIGAMPPKGGSQYSDDQLRAAVEYLVEGSK
jgi:cytochrome c5